jgi:hypothetical protein
VNKVKMAQLALKVRLALVVRQVQLALQDLAELQVQMALQDLAELQVTEV